MIGRIGLVTALVGASVLLGCSSTDEAPTGAAVAAVAEDADDASAPKGVDRSRSEVHCFRNEYGETPGEIDVEELRVEVERSRAKGAYNWLPAFKDQRRGSFEGPLSDGAVRAKYSFMQEGISETVDLLIELGAEEAVVSGGDPALGLSGTLSRVDCE